MTRIFASAIFPPSDVRRTVVADYLLWKSDSFAKGLHFKEANKKGSSAGAGRDRLPSAGDKRRQRPVSDLDRFAYCLGSSHQEPRLEGNVFCPRRRGMLCCSPAVQGRFFLKFLKRT